MTVRLAHLSDIHFGGENAAAVGGAAAWIAEHRPDLAVITGDVTRQGDEREFAAARAWINSLAAEALVLPGNHDTPYFSLPKRLFAPWRRYERHFGPLERTGLHRRGLAIASINTARGAQLRANWSKGAISARQVDHAIDALAAAEPGALKVVACHHPLVEMIGGPMSGLVHGGHDAALAFSAARVDLVLTGHVHAPFALPYPGGDGRTWAVGASTLSIRERGAPIGFNCIEVEAACVRVTALAWRGSHFEPWRTWTIDRRPTG
ncbi:MAG TPA: metallophosphoesterase [Caulobacter sp.]|nr:metallophosphoesterase [Caulobacter sp.]